MKEAETDPDLEEPEETKTENVAPASTQLHMLPESTGGAARLLPGR